MEVAKWYIKRCIENKIGAHLPFDPRSYCYYNAIVFILPYSSGDWTDVAAVLAECD